jgi:hypothetical protein
VFLEPGELIEGRRKRSFYSHAWDLARPDSFEIPAELAGASPVIPASSRDLPSL